MHFEEVSEALADDEVPPVESYYDVEEDVRNSPAHVVFSSAWSRVAIAAAAMEASSLETERLFTHHASTLGNGVIVLCTIALAAPDRSTLLPEYARAVGVASVVAAVLYQASVFVPGTFARPPAMAVLFLLCFTHDLATVIGALSCVGTCQGSGCVSLAEHGYAYSVSTSCLAVLSSMMLILPFVVPAFIIGTVSDFIFSVLSSMMLILPFVVPAFIIGTVSDFIFSVLSSMMLILPFVVPAFIIGTVSDFIFSVLSSMMLILPFVVPAFIIGTVSDFIFSVGARGTGAKVMMGLIITFFMLYGGVVSGTVLAFFPAIALSVPCLSLVATMVLGLGPRDPVAAAGHTLLHVFCDNVNAAFMEAAALVQSGSAAESVSLPPLCKSSVLCHGPTAAEMHVLRHRAAQHIGKLCFRVVETPDSRPSSPMSAAPDMPAPTATGTADDEPRREIIDEDLAQQFAVSMAEAAAVLTPHPTPAALPANVQNSPMAYLTEHLVAAEVSASVECRAPLALFVDGAGMGRPCAADSAAPTIAPGSPPATARGSENYCHIDLATETFDRALEGGWDWLLRFAWRRRAFAPPPGHATPAVFVDMWRDRGFFARTKAFGAWATLAALLLSRPVLFFAPLLEPAFNTNVPTTAYVCIAVRVVCWVGLALIAPSLYRTMCRAAAFSVVNGPEARPDFSRQFDAAARCIAAAYTPHLPTVLRRAVPHHVVSHVVIGDAVAPFVHPKQLSGAPVI